MYRDPIWPDVLIIIDALGIVGLIVAAILLA